MRWLRVFITGAALAAWATACSSSGSSGGGTGGGGGNCPDVSGVWMLTGNCADDSCSISQSGCSITASCSPTGDTYQGSVSGGSISFGDGSGTCSGTFANKTASGSCTDPSVGTCQFDATCTSGACGVTSPGGGGAPGTGGGGGTGGASSVPCDTACSAITACCSNMSYSSCMEGCQGTPSNDPACIACFKDTSCGSLTPCIIQNCDVPSELCPS